MANLNLQQLSKSFGNTCVLDKLDFDVQDGELMVLLGPSGSGKTTVLRLIAGLETPDGGSVAIGSRAVQQLPTERRNVSMVFQDHSLYPHMTVRKNIAFPLKAQRASRIVIDQRVHDVAASLQIEHLLDQRPDQLSGGQQQRVAVARSVARKSDVLLMDEPMSNIDARLRDCMRDELRRIQQQLGLTVIYVTHDQNEAMLMADRIAVLDEGKIQQVGAPNEIYDQPHNRFVAEFVGSPPMNFVPQDDGTILGIRPEDLCLQSSGAEEKTFTGPITMIQSLGHRQIVHVRCPDAILVVSIKKADHRSLGETVTLFAPADRIHRFAGGTGNRIE